MGENRKRSGKTRTGHPRPVSLRLIFLTCVLIAYESSAWDGIPKRNVMQIGSPEIREEEVEEKYYNTAPGGAENLRADNNDTDNDAMTLGQTTTESFPVLTDLEDLEAEWREFDRQWEKMKTVPSQKEIRGDHFHSVVIARSLRTLIWPVVVVFGALAMTGIIVMTVCMTRKQIYCCGKPCFDSSLDAATNYDRSELRREKIRMSKRNPLASRPLDHEEIVGIAEFLRAQSLRREHRVLSSKNSREEFMEEYDRRFLEASFPPISSTPNGNKERKNTKPEDEEMITMVKTSMRRNATDNSMNEYDEVVDIEVQQI